MRTVEIYLCNIFLIAFWVGLTSCSLKEIKKQTEVVDNSITINGVVTSSLKDKGDIYAVLLREEGGVARWVNNFKVGRDGSFTFYAAPGSYIIGAFIDLNGDDDYQSIEPANYVKQGDGQAIIYVLDKGEALEVPLLDVSHVIDRKAKRKIVRETFKGNKNVGAVASLGDPIFDLKNGELGMWKPIDFIENVGGGLFMLQPYDAKRISLILVHGILGTPKNWEYLVENIDLNKYQPWVYYYPSGARLDMISNFLLKSVNKLESEHQFKEFKVVAHSMGGLVTRSFVKKYQERGEDAKISKVMTINSPLGGLQSAKAGVSLSPIVVPAWRDVAKGSEFISVLENWRWPVSIPYALVFSFQEGKSSDGVVDLSSQIPIYLQREAEEVIGYEAEHTEILRNEEFLSDFHRLLN